MKAGDEWGKGQTMLTDEWLRMIQADREREIEQARLAREARGAAPGRSGVRAWLVSHLAETPPEPVCPQTGRAATDPSA